MEPLPSKLDKALSNFRCAMHEKLWKRRAKGDLWAEVSVETLRVWFLDELLELEQAFTTNDPQLIMDECVDVANFLMFLFARFREEWLNDNDKR